MMTMNSPAEVVDWRNFLVDVVDVDYGFDMER